MKVFYLSLDHFFKLLILSTMKKGRSTMLGKFLKLPVQIELIHFLIKVVFNLTLMHRGAYCLSFFQRIYYFGSIKSIRKDTL